MVDVYIKFKKIKILNSNLKIPMPEFIQCLVHYNSTNFNTAVTQIFAIQQEIVIQKYPSTTGG
jgi:hypothetical protein